MPLEAIFDQTFGSICVVRSGAHVVDRAVLGSVGFAVVELGVPLIMVLGHKRCGAVAATIAALRMGEHPAGEIGYLVDELTPAVRAVGIDDPDVAEKAMRAHVGRTVRRIRAMGLGGRRGRGRAGRGAVGAVYDLDTGWVTCCPDSAARSAHPGQQGDRGAVAGVAVRLQFRVPRRAQRRSRACAIASGARADAMTLRTWSSPSWMSPAAPMVARNRPRPGTCMKRSPSTPGLGSSVTSKRIIGHAGGQQPARRRYRAVPTSCTRPAACRDRPAGGPLQTDRRGEYARDRPLDVGHTASGVEWTYTTPRVGTVTSRRRGASSPTTSIRGWSCSP